MQEGENSMAKPYQIRQALLAIDKLLAMRAAAIAEAVQLVSRRLASRLTAQARSSYMEHRSSHSRRRHEADDGP